MLSVAGGEGRTDAFAARMRGLLNQGMLGLLVGFGRRSGLFDVVAAVPAATSGQIAAAAALDESLVRAWLGAMVTGRLLDHDGTRGTFSLPEGHAALADAASWDCPTALTTYLEMVAAIPPHAADADARMHHRVNAIVDRILPLAPGLVERLRTGVDVMCVGRGAEATALVLAQALPCSRFHVRDGRAALPEMLRDGGFDVAIALDPLHEQAAPGQMLADVAASVRAGGTLLCVGIAAASHLADNLDHPWGPFLYGLAVLRSAGGSAAATGWGDENVRKLLAEAAFRQVSVHRVDGDRFSHYYVARRV